MLVTGDTGFKGSWLAAWLELLGAEVIGFSIGFPTDPCHAQLLRHSWCIRGDIRDLAAVAACVRAARPEVVFHLAAQPLVLRSYREPMETLAANVLGTANVLQACLEPDLNVRVVIVITSDKCYLNREWDWPYREDDPLGGHDPYSASKACAEIVAESYQRSFYAPSRRRLATARAGNVIGGGDWSENRLIPDLVRSATDGSVVSIRNGGATRPWQHVLEPLSGYLLLGQRLLAESDGSDLPTAWNFGPDAGGALRVSEVVEEFASHWPAVRTRVASTSFPHEAAKLAVDSSRARASLRWRPIWTASTAIEKTASWYRHFVATGELITCRQVEEYVLDARRAGLEWAP